MLYFKKLVNEQYSFFASPRAPKVLDGMIAITQEEYEQEQERLEAEALALEEQLNNGEGKAQ